MKNKLHLDELEAFLQEQAESHRMYPSDRVWNQIDQQLERNRKWPALGFASAITGAIVMAGLLFLQPDKTLLEYEPQYRPANQTAPAAAASQDNKPQVGPAWQATAQRRLRSQTAADDDQLAGSGDESDESLMAESTAIAETAATAGNPLASDAAASLTSEMTDVAESSALAPVYRLQDGALLLAAGQNATLRNNRLAQQTAPGQTALAPEQPATAAAKPKAATVSKWRLQYYATPSISYRFISEVKDGDPQFFNGTTPPYYFDKVKNLVNHRPLPGLELGASFHYQLTDRVALRMGAQANYRQYAIDAFAAVPTATRLRLIDPATQASQMMPVASAASNFAGNERITLRNQFVQVAAPLGFEVALAKGKQAQFVVGTTLQPTYTIYQQAWLLSADYQEYAQAPDLMKRFNINTGMDMQFRFASRNGWQWQVGPQIRYQLQPTTRSQFPVKEQLIDYGVKFGVIKPL